VTADALWAVVSDPARLSSWVPTMRRAEPAGGEEVHLEGESHGHRYSLNSELRIDVDERRLHWGAPHDEGYHGSLQVESRSPGSELTIHVTIPDGHVPTSGDVAELRQGLDETFDRLAGLLLN
jgi:Polyketide cyclase / dehydrase and lipid transport